MTSSARAPDGGLASGDMAAVFRAHRAELVRLAAFILADKGAGEDVVQDVFAQMHARQGKLEDRGQGTPADPLPYLHRAVVNGCRSALRRRRLIRRHAEHHSPCPPLSAEEAALLSEERRQVLAALAALPRRRCDHNGGDACGARIECRSRSVRGNANPCSPLPLRRSWARCSPGNRGGGAARRHPRPLLRLAARTVESTARLRPPGRENG